MTSTDPTASVIAATLLLGLSLIAASIISTIIIFWKLFVKAGRPGWTVLVPIYNTIQASRISRTAVWFGALTGFTICALFATYSLSDPAYYQANDLIAVIFEITLLVLMARQYKISHPVWFWVGVFLAPYIAVFFVNRAEYQKMPPAAKGPRAFRA